MVVVVAVEVVAVMVSLMLQEEVEVLEEEEQPLVEVGEDLEVAGTAAEKNVPWSSPSAPCDPARRFSSKSPSPAPRAPALWPTE